MAREIGATSRAARRPNRPRRAEPRRARDAARRARAAPLPRRPDFPVDLEARRHRFRRDEQSVTRAAGVTERRLPHRDAGHHPPRPSRRTARRSWSCGCTTTGRSSASTFPTRPAQTFCVSTQVGCAMGCAFCLTGKMGLVRNLTAGEIAAQVRVLARRHRAAATAPFNIVLMGMGEPLHNYDATMKALRPAERARRHGAVARSASRCPPSVWCRCSTSWRPSR